MHNVHSIHVMRESLRKIFEMATPTWLSRPGQSTATTPHQTATKEGKDSLSLASLSLTNTNGLSSGIAGGGGISTASAYHDDKHFLINLESSKWLDHVRAVLNGAMQIVKYINDHSSSVLVHCSDGWDRTSQVSYRSLYSTHLAIKSSLRFLK